MSADKPRRLRPGVLFVARNRFRVQVQIYKLALFGVFALVGVGGYYWLDPPHLDPQVREFWMFTTKGMLILAAWLLAFVAYLVAINTRLHCPRCHTHLRLLTDLNGLARWDWGRNVKQPCPNCGLDFDQKWPPPTNIVDTELPRAISDSADAGPDNRWRVP